MKDYSKLFLGMADDAGKKLKELSSIKKEEKKEKEKEEKEKEFKGIRAGNLRRKANKILENAKSEGREGELTVLEQNRLKTLKSRAMSAEARQEARDQRYTESKARTDLKKQSYVNKMVKKGIMTAEQAKGRFDNIKGITANSAKLVNKLSNQETKSAEIEDNSSKIAYDSEPTPEELLGYSKVDTNNKIGQKYIDSINEIMDNTKLI